jgi:glyoxylase-like metal-dependent hydrolase (beta-lactamase superfamily II)/rhodanese-related sulfurtransferase
MTAKNSNKIGSPKIKAESLKLKIDQGDDIYILDVRTAEEHKSWKVSYDKYKDSAVIPIDILLSSPDALKKIPKDKEIITFCGHGNRSMSAAKTLSEKGYNAKSIEGGLHSWNNVYDIASIPTVKNTNVKIWQIRRVSKGCIGYIIVSSANNNKKNAIVIDATCSIDEPISKIVDENDLTVTKLIDTHIHADHISGATKLAKTYGAHVYISSLEGYDMTNSQDNKDDEVTIHQIKEADRIQIGEGVFLTAIHTPGHTNGSMCFRLHSGNDIKYENFDINNNNKTNYLFTGDTLFVDGVGRPDLHKKAEEFSNNLYNSYHQKILNLPNETIILPAHFSCSFEHEKPISSSLAALKEKVKLLSTTKDKFVKFITNTVMGPPNNYKEIIEINRSLIPCNKIEMKDLEVGPNSCGIQA